MTKIEGDWLKLTYKIFSKEELRDLICDEQENDSTLRWKIPVIEAHLYANKSRLMFEGFEYFKPRDLSNEYVSKELLNPKFLVCLLNDSKIIGIMKVAESEYQSVGIEYLDLVYIDVHKDYRRKGVAKGLYQLMNDTFPSDTVLISNSLSDMGEKAKLNILRKSIVTNFETYDNKFDYCKKNGLK